jgi:hypothetical protein
VREREERGRRKSPPERCGTDRQANNITRSTDCVGGSVSISYMRGAPPRVPRSLRSLGL